MPALFLLRHGPTEWTAARRLQGRSDIPLSAAGRRLIETWQLPDPVAQSEWMSSPLARATETATILCGLYHPTDVRIEPRLAEMSFGEWEGQTLTELRSVHGPVMAEWEGRGLDFRAPGGGESPRDVQERLRPWLEELGAANRNVLAITHKGVMRALYALASGWDMRGKPAQRLADNALHEFALDGGGFRIRKLNMPLQPQARPVEAPA